MEVGVVQVGDKQLWARLRAHWRVPPAMEEGEIHVYTTSGALLAGSAVLGGWPVRVWWAAEGVWG